MLKFLSKCLFLVLGLGFVAFLAGCGGRATPVEIGNKKQILHKGNGAEPEDLDPQIVTGVPENKILLSLFEGLVSMDPVDLHPVPGVAESWDISEDGRVYTFHLRENAQWSNGGPVTADDFVFSYRRILSPKLGAPYAYSLYVIQGAEDYHGGKIEDFEDVGVKAIDEKTLEITLKEPVSYFLSLMNHHAWFPVHPSTVLAYGAIDQRGSAWTRAGNMVSNGAFKLKKWEVSDSVVVERNPYYWDAETVRLNEIYFYPIEDHNAEERSFLAGQLHVTEAMPWSKVKGYRERQSPYLHIYPYFSTYTYVFNTAIKPFDDVRVRHAFSLAIDRNAVVEKVTQKGEFPAWAWVPTGAAGYNTTARLREDVEEAQRLLAEAGYPDSVGFPKVTLVFNTSENHKNVAEALQQMWAKNLNVDVELVNMEWKVFLGIRKGDDYNMMRFGWVGDYIDPNAFMEVFESNSGNNYSKWENAEYDGLLAKAAATLSRHERYDYLNDAENLLMRELPVMPVFYYNTAYLVQPNVRNWMSNIMDLQVYKYVYLEEE